MSKIIALIIVCIALYWANRYHEATKKAKKNKDLNSESKPSTGSPSSDPNQPKSSVDELKEYYEGRISEIENRSIEEINKAQGSLDYYKNELEKLKNLKK